MTRRYTHLIAVAILIAAFSAPIYAQVTGADVLRGLAERGDVEAKYYLGHMYEYGDGFPQDDAEAVRWYRLAANQGIADAQLKFGVCTSPAKAFHRLM